LVAGPGAGGKVDAAKAKGVVVWTEAEFFAAIGDGGAPTATSNATAAAAPKAAPAPKGKGKRGKAAAEEEEEEEPEVAVAPAAKKGKATKAASVPAAPKASSTESLAGKVLCFTGTLFESRSICTVRAEAAGASVSASVTAKVCACSFFFPPHR
jgi:NAD-dependent DNA ligase